MRITLSPTILAELDALAARYDVYRSTAIELAIGIAIRAGSLEGALRMAADVASRVGP